MFSEITPELVSKVFPVTPIANITANLPDILNALAEQNCDRLMLIMALATIRAEVEGFLPIGEFQSRFNTPPGGPPFSLYDNRAGLGNQGPPDGERFRGRGYIQLTGRANYTTFGPVVGVDLVANPELASDRKIAAKLLVAFLVKKKDKIHTAIASKNFASARRLVNGGTNGLARFTDAFQRADTQFPLELGK
jgi:peptidoglycan L-alanyl-D-glutamate endopeptidase CwlK